MIISGNELNAMSALALAHMGDAVYELLARAAQAVAARRLQPFLTEEETAVYRRGRNSHSHAAPRSVSAVEYHAATGLEALFGWLYLREEKQRLEELFAIIMEEDHAAGRNGTDGTAR